VNISHGYLQRGWTARGREIGKILQDSNPVLSMACYSLIAGLGEAVISSRYPKSREFREF
jgi:hypothetical protein